ncbi:MAG: hypothetical protein Q4A62_04060 [Eikenella sp.]|nr:hypothetical protein [Eikenella sp.]
MTDFIQELSKCRAYGTPVPFRPAAVRGYTEQEIERISRRYNLNIHGQFRQLLLQMGRCSGGLVWSDEITLYDHRWQPRLFRQYQAAESQAIRDDAAIQTGYLKSGIHPITHKFFPWRFRNDRAAAYCLVTEERDDYLWHQYDDGFTIKKTAFTLLEDLRHTVEAVTKRALGLGYGYTEEDFKLFTTGRLL